jgi:hypothetical protein
VHGDPRVQVCPLTVVKENASCAFGTAASLPSTPPDVVVTIPAVLSGIVTVPVNVGEADVASADSSVLELWMPPLASPVITPPFVLAPPDAVKMAVSVP